MSVLPDNIASGLAVKESDKTYAALMILLDESIKSETAVAIGPEFSAPEKRAWQCGRADALTSFKELLVSVRKDAIEQRGLRDAMINE
jgi:hypothetical protein